MSWQGTFTYVIARAADVMTASIIWRQPDVTISSHCGLELRKPKGNWFLRGLGRLLNRMQAGHTEMAIRGDIQEAKEAIQFLGG